MKVLIIPDSFKGSLSSTEVASALEIGISNVLPEAKCKSIGLADGGEVSLDFWLKITRGIQKEVQVSNAYNEPIKAAFGWDETTRTAFVEVAQASGMAGICSTDLNPLLATSFGTGVIVNSAIESDAQKIILSLGGSATIDGGAGIMQALGAEFRDVNGKKVPVSGNPLISFQSVDLTPVFKYADINWLLLCDVNNPLTGLNGAARVFGPQKGATPNMVELFDNRLEYWHSQLLQHHGKFVSGLPGSGAAGGIAIPFLSLFHAELDSGFDWFSKNIGLETLLSQFDYVVTGEGYIDAQTWMGKGVGKIAHMAKKAGCTVIGVAGKIEPGIGIFDAVFQLTNQNISISYSMTHAKELLEKAGEACARFIAE